MATFERAAANFVEAIEAIRAPMRAAVDLCNENAALFTSPPRLDRDAHPLATSLRAIEDHLAHLVAIGGAVGDSAADALDRFRVGMARASELMGPSSRDDMATMVGVMAAAQRMAWVRGIRASLCDDGCVARADRIVAFAEAVRPFSAADADMVRLLAPVFDGYPLTPDGSWGGDDGTGVAEYVTGVLCALRDADPGVFEAVYSGGADALASFLSMVTARYEAESPGVAPYLRHLSRASCAWVKSQGVTARDLMATNTA